MKTKFLTLSMIALLAITTISCSKDEPATTPVVTNPTTAGNFTAIIDGVNFATNEITLAQISAGGTQAFYTTPKNGISFSSAIFPDQFPIGVAKNIAYSPSISYKLGEVTYIPKSGTMTITVMENYKKMKGTFSGVFVGGNGSTEVAISGSFDVSNP